MRDVLTNDIDFEKIDCSELINWIDNNDNKHPSLLTLFKTSKEAKEAQISDDIIRPVLEMLGHRLRPQVTLNNDYIDYCLYSEDLFADDFSNTTAIVEAKRFGRIENKYFIKKKDNSDEIYQSLNYLRTVNLTLQHHSSQHSVDYVILTDGYRWRVYSNKYTHSENEFEKHFIEFDLEAIAQHPNTNARDRMLKLFAMIAGHKALANGKLAKYQKESAELEVTVTTELRQQTFLALEHIATGLWREIAIKKNPNLLNTLTYQYHIDGYAIDTDNEVRSQVLRIVYDESLIYLLRLLFVLYAEDRKLFSFEDRSNSIPKVIKGKNNLLEYIISQNKGIGELTCFDESQRSDDMKLADVFAKIDQKYNGGLFSSAKHPLLFRLDIDDELFMNAIDNLCRIETKNGKICTVDFSAISTRELGSIYESLLEYKLAVIDTDEEELPSIVKKGRIRHHVQKGDLELVDHNGQRKATGSYYTPDLIVEHLINTTLMPKLEAIKASHPDDLKGLLDEIYKLRICDPAMGCGHMLQAAYSRIIRFIHQYVEEYSQNHTEVVWDDIFAYSIRGQVARKCIYGVDLNPVAVELAKLIMWMRLFRPDKAFEFFDYNLACGNSIIGVYDDVKLEAKDSAWTVDLFRSQEEIEESIQKELLSCVRTMLDMPRDSVENIHAVERYYQSVVKPMQSQVTFFYNIKLAQWLIPEKADEVKDSLETLANGIDLDSNYVKKILANDTSLPEKIRQLSAIDKQIRENYQPLHWRIAFPHITLAGGFDVIITNPPWDKVKPFRNEFFRDYIQGYRRMDTTTAKAASEQLLSSNPIIKAKWDNYEATFENQNRFYKDAYHYQTWKESKSKTKKGDTNLFIVFIEKVYTILKEGGACGAVIPDNFTSDNGCSGLRHLLFDKATIKEIIMFENRKKLFEIDSRYKFDVLTFLKQQSQNNAHFTAGFMWYDPVWLDYIPSEEYIKLNPERNDRCYHLRFSYPVQIIREFNEDTLAIIKFQEKQLDALNKMRRFSKIGDIKQTLYFSTYREFDMTNDADLFRFNGQGWPLLEGKTIYHFDAHYAKPERTIIQSEGEGRLAKKRRKDVKDLRDRTYRIAWRNITNSTNERGLISTVLPRGVFTGNSLNLIDIIINGKSCQDYVVISGVNAVMSSMTADFFLRCCINTNLSAFILKTLPFPRDIQIIKELGQMAMPLYYGDDFEVFRGGITAIADENERNKLKAKLDARVAHFYGLSYENYQSILQSFRLVDEDYKKRCLIEYKEWSFQL